MDYYSPRLPKMFSQIFFFPSKKLNSLVESGLTNKIMCKLTISISKYIYKILDSLFKAGIIGTIRNRISVCTV